MGFKKCASAVPSLGQQCKTSFSLSGFTLIELLTVICIIAILSAFLLRAVSASKQRAYSILCLNNKRQLATAWHIYAGDFLEYVPPNIGDDKVKDNFNWVAGNSGKNGLHEFNTDILRSNTTSMLYPHLSEDFRVYRCPADLRKGRSQNSEKNSNQIIPSARSISMNLAIGTDPNEGGRLAVKGYWLNGEEGNGRDGPFCTFAQMGDFLNPGPASTWLFIDEAPFNLNDCAFAMSMVGAFWLDYPGRYHAGSATISYADGHAELRKWRTFHNPTSRQNEAQNPDWVWLRDRTSAFRPL